MSGLSADDIERMERAGSRAQNHRHRDTNSMRSPVSPMTSPSPSLRSARTPTLTPSPSSSSGMRPFPSSAQAPPSNIASPFTSHTPSSKPPSTLSRFASRLKRSVTAVTNTATDPEWVRWKSSQFSRHQQEAKQHEADDVKNFNQRFPRGTQDAHLQYPREFWEFQMDRDWKRYEESERRRAMEDAEEMRRLRDRQQERRELKQARFSRIVQEANEKEHS